MGPRHDRMLSPRRWLRFRLSSLLLLMIVAAVALTYLVDRPKPVAMDGYCPVTLTTRSTWKPGDAQYRETYEGLTYYFVGEQEREAFVKDPAKYCLAAGGTDVVTLKTSGQALPGSRRFGFRYQGQTFLFSSSATMSQFAGKPQEFANFASTLSGRH